MGFPKQYSNKDVRGELKAKKITVTDEFSLPLTDGLPGQLMITDGGGVVYWTDPSTIIDTSTIEVFDDVNYLTSPTTIPDGSILRWQSGAWVPDQVAALSNTWVWTAGRNHPNTTLRYLDRTDGISTNLSPFIIPYDTKLESLSIATNGPETWILELRKNGTTVATLSAIAESTKFSNAYNITFSAGDEISFYCNGTGVNSPTVSAWFVKED